MNSSRRPLISFDWAMKRLLRQKANYGILEGFLTTLLKQDVRIEQILESESNKDRPENKSNRVDLLCKTQQNELVLVELQFDSEYDYFQRMMFGTSRLMVDFLAKGDPYVNVKKIYSINVVYFDLGQGEDYVYHGTTQFRGLHKPDDVLKLSQKSSSLYPATDVYELFPEYYIIKVNNFNELAKDPLDEWIYYFKNNRLPDNFSAKGLEGVREQLRVDDMTDQEYIEYQQSIKEERISLGMLQSAKIDGEWDGQRRIVLHLQAQGKSVVEIAELIGLSKERIEALLSHP